MNKGFDLISVALRYLCLSIFGALVTKGYLDSSLVEPLSGFALALFAVLWFYISKVRTPKNKDKMNDIQEET